MSLQLPCIETEADVKERCRCVSARWSSLLRQLADLQQQWTILILNMVKKDDEGMCLNISTMFSRYEFKLGFDICHLNLMTWVEISLCHVMSC